MQSDLRLTHLRERTQVDSKLMNVKVPDTLEEALHRAVKELGCTKTAVVIALLNEGLDAFAERRTELVPSGGRPTPKRKRRGRPSKPTR
jgi:hypothetical protein